MLQDPYHYIINKKKKFLPLFNIEYFSGLLWKECFALLRVADFCH